MIDDSLYIYKYIYIHTCIYIYAHIGSAHIRSIHKAVHWHILSVLIAAETRAMRKNSVDAADKTSF